MPGWENVILSSADGTNVELERVPRRPRNDASVIVCALLLIVSGCTRRSETKTFQQSPQPPAIAIASGKPVLAYHIITPRVPLDCGLCLGRDFALIEQSHHPTQQELVDLAVDLHLKNPVRSIYIIDSAGGIGPYISFLANPLVEPIPTDWMASHVYAFVSFRYSDVSEKSGQWTLVSEGGFADADKQSYIDGDKTIAILGPTETTPDGLNKPRPVPSAEAIPRKNDTTLDTKAEFESSPFCMRYSCENANENYVLGNGDENVTYHTTVPNLEVQTSIKSNTIKVATIGLIFHDRPALSKEDMAAINTVIRDVGDVKAVKNVMAFIRKNIEVPVCPTCLVTSSPDFRMLGPFKVTAGSAGEPELWLNRVWPKSQN